MKSLIPWRHKEHNTAPAPWDGNWFDGTWPALTEDFSAPLMKSFSWRIPSVDVSEDKNGITVRAEAPGLTEKEIELTWLDGVLRIRGEKREEKQGKRYRECRYGSFTRDIPVGDSVNWKAATAKYKHGVLTVRLPRAANALKAIEIKVN